MPSNKIALYSPTKNLTTKYIFENDKHESGSIILNSKKIHAQLYAACSDFKKKRSRLKNANGNPVYTSSIKGVNFSTAAISVLYADTTPEEGYIGENILSASFAVFSFQSERLTTCSNLYQIDSSFLQNSVTATNKALRNSDFNFRLSQRIKSFSRLANFYHYGNAVTSVAELNNTIANSNFHELFHHTEQGEMEVLSSPLGIECLTDNILELDAKYVYGLVLDIYTDRPMCCNCNACLIGMQCSQAKGFLADFAKPLNKVGIFTRENDNLMLSVRVSTAYNDEPFNLASSVVHQYNPDKKRVIYQASHSQLNVNQIIREKGYSLSTFPGSIFTSKKVSAEKLHSDIGLTEEAILPTLEL